MTNYTIPRRDPQGDRALPIADAIPPELKDVPHWVTWQLKRRDGRDTKIPYSRDGKPASSTDPATWTTFNEAWSALERNTAFSGVGFVFTARDPYVGIDLDHAVQDGELQSWAADIVRTLDSYTELSPSGTGLHIVCRGKLPANGRRRASVEIYDRGRFFTVTGAHVAGSPTTIEQRDEAVAEVHAEHVARTETPSGVNPPVNPLDAFEIDDAEILRLISRAKNGAKTAALWAGDLSRYDGNESRADLALCSDLAFWTAGNHAQIDRLFRFSGLMRPKWGDRPDYRTSTIDLAIRSTRNHYSTRGRA